MIASQKKDLSFSELASSIRQAHDLFSAQATYLRIVETVTPQFIAILKNKNQWYLLYSKAGAFSQQPIGFLQAEQELFIDLLFYRTKLRCFIVIELNIINFQPEHAGKLNFYLKAVDSPLRTEQNMATIAILICKRKDKVGVEYALSDIHKPIGASEYQLTQSLPKKLKSSLPSIEEIEKELGGQQ